MTARRRRLLLDAGACAAGAGVVCAVWIQRLPAVPDFILARAVGDFLVLPLARFFQSGGGRAAGAWLALLLLAGSPAFPAVVLWTGRRELFSAARSPRRRAKKIALFALGAVSLALCARWGVSAAVDVVENAWFEPESLAPLEPLILMGAATGFAMLLWRAVGGLWGRVFSRRRERWTLALALAALCCDGGGRLFYDAGKPSLARAAGLAQEAKRGRLVLVLKQQEGRPVVEAHELVMGVSEQTQYSAVSLKTIESYVGRRTVFRRPALRYLYAGATMAMDAPGVRSALALGEAYGDVLARALLLDHLAVAPPGPPPAAILDTLADERVHRIGAAGWARLAFVAAHLGLPEKAEAFRRRAATGPGGVPSGLFEPPETGGALLPGRIEGRVTGRQVAGARLAVYCRPTPESPYSLGPGQLVASAILEGNGRFRFSGLAAGDYFLALAVDSADERPPRLSVSGNRGDLRLSARRPRAQVFLRLTPTR